MLLAVDVGNTNVTVGAFAGQSLRARWRMRTDPQADAGALGRALARAARRRGARVEACVYGSVVPSLDKALERAVRTSFGVAAVAVTPRSPLGIRLRVREPLRVGADRLLNALAAHRRARGAAAVVVDFGTATTFDCVAAGGDYLGGAILPGPRLAAEALHERTAKLPLVAMARPRRVVGKDTVECIRAGLYWGYLGAIEKVLALTLRELGGRPRLFATGGLASLFRRDLPESMLPAPDLTLEGLRIAHERLR
ncbi:MAG: type III pantothenate kinase [Elusimicrobia bacterium]|nr:type III pantothenate kinase [Elusimicrobiota bacterium]MDE2237128.1 type III pantothenate kinase [Elusimicrobiota bacterium]MDE2424736.1 type III pantothenate kinase [Elusimicrobiota bacterium]